MRISTILPVIALLILSAARTAAQLPQNPGFEERDPVTGDPLHWRLKSSTDRPSGYLTGIDSLERREGRYALRIASDPAAASRLFGVCGNRFPASFAGDSIVLRGWMKTAQVSEKGFAGLWLRIDGEGGSLEFDNMHTQHIFGNTAWTEYRISLPFPADARWIYFGGLLVDTGTVWFDDFRFEVDGRDIGEAERREIVYFPAELDSAFYGGSGIDLPPLDMDRIRDLTLLGQIWGLLKYHHPAVVGGDHNWDFMLFRVLPRLLTANGTIERDRLLFQWIDTLGVIVPPGVHDVRGNRTEEVKLEPDYEWIERTDMAEELRQQLRNIAALAQPSEQYYIAFVDGIGNPDFRNEHDYADMDPEDDGYRMLALFRYWNMIQYYFPYRYAIGGDWKRVLAEFVPIFAAAADPLAYRLACLRLIGRVNDTHANIWMEDSVLTAYRGNFAAPVRTRLVEDSLVIVGWYDEGDTGGTGLARGDVITAVDGQLVWDLINARLEYYPASNLRRKLSDISRRLLDGSTDSVVLTVRRNGENETAEVILPRIPLDRLDRSADRHEVRPDSCIRFLTEDIGYLHLGTLEEELIPGAFEAFAGTRGIVIDIRDYPAEFVIYPLGRQLLAEPTPFCSITTCDTERPGQFVFRSTLNIGEPNPAPYGGVVVILVNERSLSQSEFTAMGLRQAPRAVVVGSQTAAADGNVSRIALPGGIMTAISGIGIYYPDGMETQRIGIIPDIECIPTVRGIREGRDELIERAIQHILNS